MCGWGSDVAEMGKTYFNCYWARMRAIMAFTLLSSLYFSGLDPAGPLFEPYDWSVGLNPSCADLVDNIHTNTEIIPGIGAGMMKAVGHIDFYPNGGRSQPGCVMNQYGVIPVVKDFVTCNNQIEICGRKLTIDEINVFDCMQIPALFLLHFVIS